jgi:hypothetical protein
MWSQKFGLFNHCKKNRRKNFQRRLQLEALEGRAVMAGLPILSEFVADNNITLDDGFGESPDWIEIYNAGDAVVDLQGYRLTDSAADPAKWSFPTSTLLGVNQYLIVFASGRDVLDPLGYRHTNFSLNASGEYIGLSSPTGVLLSEFGSSASSFPLQVEDVSYGRSGTTLITGNSIANYLIPTVGSLGNTWTSPSFNAAANGFTLGRASIGYEAAPGSANNYTGYFNTTVPNGTTSLYSRIQFQIPNVAELTSMTLNTKFDDGVAIYLNGIQIVSEFTPTPLTYNSLATGSRDDGVVLAGNAYSLTPYLNLLVNGTNTLAFQLLNTSAGSSDLLFAPELVTTSLTGTSGYMSRPTPGAPNAQLQTPGPTISSVTPNPAIAVANQSLKITASVAALSSPVDTNSVRLTYRIGFGGESTIGMLDNGTNGDATAGDGIYTANIPGNSLSAGQLVRWYVTASSTSGNSSRQPKYLDPLDSAQYAGTVVSDLSIITDIPVMQWYVENEAEASTFNGARGSLFYRGELFDNILTNSHGQSTRGGEFIKKSFDFDANSGNRFSVADGIGRVSDFNLLTNYADQTKLRHTLANDVFRQAGYAYNLSFSVMVYRNGSFYGLYDRVEEGQSEMLLRLGNSPENALYKVNNPLNDANQGVEKKSRRYEDNSDLQQIVDANNNLNGISAATWDYDHLDIADWVNYLAVQTLTGNIDFGHKNMYLYRDTTGTQQWSIYPWDLDLSFGHNWNQNWSPNYMDPTLYATGDLNVGWNNTIQRQYQDSRFSSMYVRRLRSLMDEIYGAPGTNVSSSYLGQKILGLQNLLRDEAVQDENLWGRHPNFLQTPDQAMTELIQSFIPLKRDALEARAQIPDPQVGNPAIVIDPLDFDATPVSGLQTQEYIKLNNPTNVAVDISKWRISGGIDHQFKSGTVIPANSSLYVVADVVGFQARTVGPRGGQRLLIQGNYTGQLSNTGETVQLIASDGTVMSTLTTPPGTGTNNQQFLRISEIHYNPKSVTGTEEFIELVNISGGANAITLDLSGVRITDGPTTPYVFASGTSLASGQRLLVVRDRASFIAAYPSVPTARIASGVFVGSLSNGGEKVRIAEPGDSTIMEFTYNDNDPWPISPDGAGASLQLIDEANTPIERIGKYYSWRGSVEAGGSPGLASLTPNGIVINEILAHTDLPEVDSIELYNTTNQPINVGGWYLSDSTTDLLKYRIPAGTVIGAKQYLVLNENQFNPTPLTPGPKDFRLSAVGDDVWLTIPNAAGDAVSQFVDQIAFDATLNGVSIGRSPNGSGPFGYMSAKTLGTANAKTLSGPIVISEINYSPGNPSAAALLVLPTVTTEDLEFIEISNASSSLQSLTEWRIRGASDYSFVSGSSLASGSSLVIVSFDPSLATNSGKLLAFRAQYGLSNTVPLVGPYSSVLSNSYGRITLQRPDVSPPGTPTVIPRLLSDEVVYDDTTPFPTVADGTGPTLNRLSASRFGRDGSSWVAAAPTPGIFMVSQPLVVVSQSANITNVSEGGAVDSISLVLDTAPNANVAITVSPNAQLNLGLGAGVAITRTFTPTNWDLPQTLTIEAVDDSAVEGSHIGTLAFGVGSSDGRYQGQAIQGISVLIADNDSLKISTVVLGDGTPQRSIVNKLTIDFSTLVTIVGSAFTLEQRNGANWESIPLAQLTVNYVTALFNNNTQTRVLLTFSGSDIVGGSLADGNYRLTIQSSAVTSGGQSVDGNGDGVAGDDFVIGTNPTDNFFRFFGDSDGDRTVGLAELNRLRRSLNKSFGESSFDSRFDFDQNGVVSLSDLNRLRQRFNKTI